MGDWSQVHRLKPEAEAASSYSWEEVEKDVIPAWGYSF